MSARLLLALFGLALLVSTTSMAAPPTSRPSTGPQVVVLKQLENLYEPVPFEHAKHAEMAHMSDGCTMCHHHTPDPTTRPAGFRLDVNHQDAAAEVPACDSCHPPAADKADLAKPTLKGAYHRQCLNCHRDWTGENACAVCHAAKEGGLAKPPSADDITGRMHPPIKAKEQIPLKAQVEPVAGANVLFRHQEHIARFNLRCVQCHRRDSCGDCHAKDSTNGTKVHPVQHARTWQQSHEPCIACHEQDRCEHCHYRDGQQAPAAFEHGRSGQTLDKDHLNLACAACHAQWKTREQIGCGDATCHHGKTIAFPHQRPGAFVVAAAPTTLPTTAPATQPSTRPVIVRIRRGGL